MAGKINSLVLQIFYLNPASSKKSDFNKKCNAQKNCCFSSEKGRIFSIFTNFEFDADMIPMLIMPPTVSMLQ